MKIRYATGVEDVVAFHRQRFQREPSLRRLRALLLWPVPVTVVVVSGLVSYGRGNLALLLFGSVIAVAYAALVPRAIRCNYEGMIRRRCLAEGRGSPLGQHVLEIAADRILEHTDHGEVTTRLTGVRRVVHTAAHVFIERDGTPPWIIPRQAVTAGDLAAFVAALERNRQTTP